MYAETSTHSPHAGPDLTRRHRWTALIVLSASLLVVTMDLTILNIALPKISADIRPTSSEQLWIVDAYSLVLAGLLIPMSALADRFGRKLVLLVGVGIFGAAPLLVLLAEEPSHVIAVRALLGLGGAMVMPTTLSMLRSIFTDPKERSTALGVWAAVSGLGAGVGPLVAGGLLERYDWHAVFLVNTPLMAAALIAGLLILPEVRAESIGSWDFISTVLSIAGMVSLVWAIKHFAQERDLLDLPSWAAMVAAIVLLSLFVRSCLRQDSPLLDVRILLNAPVRAGVLLALSTMVAIAAFLLLLAQWMQLVRGDDPIEAGVRLLPLAAGGLVASLIAPWMAQTIGPRSVSTGALALSAVGAALIPLAPTPLTYGWALPSMVLVGAGTGALAVASAMIMLGTPISRAGSAAAIEETAYDLGTVLGVAIFGSVASAIYTSKFDTEPYVAQGLPPEAADAADQSLGAAVEIAHEVDSASLAADSGEVFTIALADTSLAIAAFMGVMALVVWRTIPKGLDVTEQLH